MAPKFLCHHELYIYLLVHRVQQLPSVRLKTQCYPTSRYTSEATRVPLQSSDAATPPELSALLADEVEVLGLPVLPAWPLQRPRTTLSWSEGSCAGTVSVIPDRLLERRQLAVQPTPALKVFNFFFFRSH